MQHQMGAAGLAHMNCLQAEKSFWRFKEGPATSSDFSGLCFCHQVGLDFQPWRPIFLHVDNFEDCIFLEIKVLISAFESTSAFSFCRQYNAHSGAERLGHEEGGAGHLQAFGSQAHAQLQSQLQLQRHVQPKVSAANPDLLSCFQHYVLHIL